MYYIIKLLNESVVDVETFPDDDSMDYSWELYGRQLGLGTAIGFDSLKFFFKPE